jgi:predicted outer membrane protein
MKKHTLPTSTRMAILAAILSCPLCLMAQNDYPSGAGTSRDRSGSMGADRDNDSDKLKWGDRRFLQKAAEGNEKELAFAQLASRQATNAEVRSFAQHLVSDHQNMDRELVQLAQAKGVDLDRRSGSMSSSRGGITGSDRSATGAYDRSGAGSGQTGSSSGMYSDAGSSAGMPSDSGTAVSAPALGWNGERQYRRLAGENSADFDREFIEMMVDEHESNVKAFEKTADKADDPEVKAFAAKYVPALRQHLDQAKSLQNTLK